MTMHKALYPSDDVDCMCQEKKKEEDLRALKIVRMNQNKDLKTTLKKSKGRLIRAANESTGLSIDQKKKKNKNYETEMVRKTTTIWIFQATIWWNYTRKHGHNSQERNLISFNSRAKRYPRDWLC